MSKYTFRRYLLFVASLFINAFGIAFITKALLGTSPITSVTYVLSLFTPFTMGIWTILLNLLFVVLEPFLMTRRELREDLRMYLLQIPIAFCFGLFIDFSMFMLFWLEPSAYVMKVTVLLVGCVILALGIALEVKANAAMMAGEYLVKAITRRFHGEFGYVKLGFDVTLLTIACILSLVFLSDIQGVREGTVVSALLVGPIVHFVNPAYHVFDHWINAPIKQADTPSAQHTNTIITIAREYGSGGHLLGERLAKELGIKLYDREFIRMAAQRSGIDEQYIAKNEQSIPSFWLKCILSKNSEQPVEASLSADDILFVAESRIVQELAAQEPCIIVGRCADFVLKDHQVVKVFCYSDLKSAVNRCVNDYGIPQEQAEAEIRRINRNRIHHYEYYTGWKWGKPHHYHLMLNTGNISLETACKLVKEVYQNIAKA